jgi:hypothetical protein
MYTAAVVNVCKVNLNKATVVYHPKRIRKYQFKTKNNLLHNSRTHLNKKKQL